MEKATILALFLAIPLAVIAVNMLPGNTGKAPLTPEEITANPGDYIGEEISVEANTSQGPAMCTQMACIGENKCCNTCSGSVNIGDGEITLTGEGIGCSGTNCGMNCTPETGKKYVLNGVLENNSNRLSLNISDYERVEN
jgi:hypothetical protein